MVIYIYSYKYNNCVEIAGPETSELTTQMFERLRGADTFAQQRRAEIAGCKDVCIQAQSIHCWGTETDFCTTGAVDIVYPYEENTGCMDQLCGIITLFVLCDALGVVFVHVRAKFLQ